MSDLRKAIVKLAREVPETRKFLVPLLRNAADESFDDAIKGKKFKNPDTGNDVTFGALPADEQKKVREEWAKKNKKKDDGKKDDSKDANYYIGLSTSNAREEVKDASSDELDEIWDKIKDADGYKFNIVMMMAFHKNLSPKLREVLEGVQPLSIAQSGYTPAESFERLSKNKSSTVRYYVAQNKKTPAGVLEYLYKNDTDKENRVVAIGNMGAYHRKEYDEIMAKELEEKENKKKKNTVNKGKTETGFSSAKDVVKSITNGTSSSRLTGKSKKLFTDYITNTIENAKDDGDDIGTHSGMKAVIEGLKEISQSDLSEANTEDYGSDADIEDVHEEIQDAIKHLESLSKKK